MKIPNYSLLKGLRLYATAIYIVCISSIMSNALSANCDSVIPTNVWCDFYGSVNCSCPAPVGTAIKAYTPEGLICGCYIVEYEGQCGFMEVFGDDCYTEIKDGAAPGDTITFYIDSLPAEAIGNAV
jgi:hypothetical protein